MPVHVLFLNIRLNKWDGVCLPPHATLSRASQSFPLSLINKHDSDKHSKVPIFPFFSWLYCFMAPHCQACLHMYFHVIFWMCQEDDKGKSGRVRGAGGSFMSVLNPDSIHKFIGLLEDTFSKCHKNTNLSQNNELLTQNHLLASQHYE